jgi:apolipoprotein N-acyltransferase
MPYHLSGHALVGNPMLRQLVDPIGVYGLAVLVGTISGLVAIAAGTDADSKLRARLRVWLAPGVALAGVHILGAILWFRADMVPGERVIAVAITSDALTSAGRVEQMQAHLLEAIARSDVDLIVIPEMMVLRRDPELDPAPGYIDESWLCRAIAESGSRATVIAGLMTRESRATDPVTRYRNSIAVIDARGVCERRDKHWYSPIDEVQAFRDFPLIRRLGQWMSSREAVPVRVDVTGSIVAGDLDLAVCICFDSMMPHVWRVRRHGGSPDLQVVIANLVGLDGSVVQHEQSLAARVLHAIDLRTPLLYVTTHRSEWIDARGRVHRLGEDARTGWTADIPLNRSTPISN